MRRTNNSMGVWVWLSVIGLFAVAGLISVTNANAEKTETVTETENIPYTVEYVEDASVEYGKTVTRTAGATGKKVSTYKVKSRGGKVISRELVESAVSQEPVNAVVARGTKAVWRCHDATSYDRNPYNDNYCEYSDGSWKYVPDSEAKALDPTYTPGRAGAAYYNNF